MWLIVAFWLSLAILAFIVVIWFRSYRSWDEFKRELRADFGMKEKDE